MEIGCGAAGGFATSLVDVVLPVFAVSFV
jgi:hypothetical protein